MRLLRGSSKRQAIRKARRQKIVRHPDNTRHYGTLKVSKIPIQIEHCPQVFWETIKASKEDRKLLFVRRRKVLEGRVCRRSSNLKHKNRSELDSHADTCLAGANTVLIGDDGRTTSVCSSINDIYDNVTIGTVATYWISDDGTPYILIIHEALYFGDKVKITLLTPNQMRHFGLVVDDVPRQFDLSSTHSIYDPVSRVRIPLSLNGVCSGFTSYKPTAKQLRTTARIYLTSDQPWEPYSGALEQTERDACIRLESQADNDIGRANPFSQEKTHPIS
jgi:hypothetical protein